MYLVTDQHLKHGLLHSMNDTDFMIRNAMERWQNGINDYANNTGVIAPADYQTDLTVEQLDRDELV